MFKAGMPTVLDVARTVALYCEKLLRILEADHVITPQHTAHLQV